MAAGVGHRAKRPAIAALAALAVALAASAPALAHVRAEGTLAEGWSRAAAAPGATAAASPSAAPEEARAPAAAVSADFPTLPDSAFPNPPAAPAASATSPAVPGDVDEGGVSDAKLVVVPAASPSESDPAMMQPASPPSTAVIPRAAAPTAAAGTGDVAAYVSQNSSQYPAMLPAPQPGSLQDFLAQGGGMMLPIGVELREARRRVRAGGVAEGLLVIDVRPGSPAAQAGVRPLRETAHEVIQGVAVLASVAAGMVFPPAMMGVVAAGDIPGGESYDMIIGVDGTPVTNLVDFEDRMQICKPGELVYFNILRDGRRLQLPVQIPSAAPVTY